MMILVADCSDGNMQLLVVKMMILLFTKVLMAVILLMTMTIMVNDNDN